MSLSLNRREFLARTALVAASSGGLQAVEALAAPPRRISTIPIIDTHVHLWDLDRFRLRWIEAGEYREIARNYSLEDYREETRGHDVVKAVYMEVDVEPSQQAAEAEYIIELCRAKDPLAAAVISGRPATDGFKAYLTRFRDSPYIKGVREVLAEPRTPRGYCLDPAFLRGVRLLGELGLCFDIALRRDELADAAKLAAACPDTRFVLDHCGNPDLRAGDLASWKRDLASVARRENVVCKISGFVTTAEKGAWTSEDLAPVINHAYEVFGPGRVMFGSDWPVCNLTATYGQWVDALAEVVRDRGEREQQLLFRDNAARFYGLQV